MAKFATLNDAMSAKDSLAEAELRYQLLAEAFEDEPKLRSQLNPALDKAKAEIMQLRALAPTSGAEQQSVSGKVVAFDAERFRKSG
jgi:hypothetical protein